MTRLVPLSVCIAFAAVLAAAFPFTPRVEPSRGLKIAFDEHGELAPEERSRALQDPHDSLWSQPAPGIYRVRITTSTGIILLGESLQRE